MKAALAGHICRCSAYPDIIRTVIDSAAVLRGSKTPIEPEPESIVQIKMPMVRDYSTTGGHFAGRRSGRRREQDRHEEVAGLSARKSQRIWASRCRRCPKSPSRDSPAKRSTPAACGFRICCTSKFLTWPHPHARIEDIDTSAAEKMPGVRTSSPTRTRRSCSVPTLRGAGSCPSLCRGNSTCKAKSSPSSSPRPKTWRRTPPTRSRSSTKFCPSRRC